MPDPLTIPSAHLKGMEGSDPPVRFTDTKGRQWSWHPNDCDCDEADVLDFGDEFGDRLEDGTGVLLLVEQSMHALLRMLARQYGAKLQPGEVPQWRKRDGWWYLAASGMGNARVFVPHPLPPPLVEPGAVLFFHVPALTADMDRLEALATVLAWLVSR